MDLIASTANRLRGWALGRPRVAVLASPERTSTGWRVEAAAASRGWPRAGSPADADVLVVVGDHATDLARACGLWWHHMTAPRSRVDISGEADHESGIDELLDAALVRLRDRDTQRAAATRTGEAAELLEQRRTPHGSADDQHGGHDVGGHDMGGHAGHDMGSVAGLSMASTGQDRDGLALDVLVHRWGPFLPGWPAGLVVRTTLSGDVVTSAVVEQGPSRPETFPRPVAVAHALVTVLDLAGWTEAAKVLSHVPLARLDAIAPTGAEQRWLSRVRRSRTLRWALRDVAVVDDQDAADRVAQWCEELLTGAKGGTGQVGWTVHPAADLVPLVVVGTELARARIAVASLALSPGRPGGTGSGAEPHAHHQHHHTDHGGAS